MGKDLDKGARIQINLISKAATVQGVLISKDVVKLDFFIPCDISGLPRLDVLLLIVVAVGLHELNNLTCLHAGRLISPQHLKEQVTGTIVVSLAVIA